MQRALAALMLVAAMLALPAAAFAQSAGDEQYTDPFQGGGNGGQAEQPAQEQPEPAPAPPPEQPAGQVPAEEDAPAAEPAQTTSPTLPRTGAPVVLLAAAGYALLLAGIAIRRQT
jgi:hypothetical protein